MTMMQFKLKSGRHFGRAPECSDDDWLQTKTKMHSRIKIYEKGEIIQSTEDLEKKDPDRYEKLVPGLNVPREVTEERRQAVLQLIQQGGWTKEDKTFLEQLADEDFARVVRISSRGGTGQQRPSGPLGEDVTDQFGMAYDNGLKVFKNAAELYQVTRSNNTSKPINKEGLTRDKAVEWIDQHLKGK